MKKVGLDMEKARAMLNSRGTTEWVDFRTSHHLDGDAYTHLMPNFDRIKISEGDIDLTDEVLYDLVGKIRGLRSSQ